MRKKTNTEKQANHNTFQQDTKKSTINRYQHTPTAHAVGFFPVRHEIVLQRSCWLTQSYCFFTVDDALPIGFISDSFVGNEKKGARHQRMCLTPFCRRVYFSFGGAAAVSICVTGAAEAVLISPAVVAVYLILFICLLSPSGGRPLQAGHTFFFFFISSHLLSDLCLFISGGGERVLPAVSVALWTFFVRSPLGDIEFV